ncbi:MAG: hypothetical protein ACI9CB_002456 [Rhodothermales bacterium]|jgi:hypothetical protein
MINENCISNRYQSQVFASSGVAHEASILKPTLVLTAALFLMMAPDPDAKVIAELTSNFIVPTAQVEFLPQD